MRCKQHSQPAPSSLPRGLPAAAGSCGHQLPPNFSLPGACKAAQLKSITMRFFFQARCLPEAEIFKVLVEMFTSEMGMKKKIILLILLKTYSGLPGCRAALQHHRGVVSAAFSVSTSTRFNQSTSYTSAERFQVTPSQLASNCRVKWGEKGS